MRLIRGLAALVVLTVGLIGVPALLVVLVGNPLPAGTSWTEVVAGLARPDDGTILVGLVTAAAWVGWLVFAISVVVEAVAVLSRQRVRITLPGLAAPQRLASGLVLAVIALSTATPQVTHAEPAQSAPQLAVPAAETAATSDRAETVRSTASQTEDAGLRHTVQRGDDLWSLAERFYGEGRDWRRIAAANPDVLTGGPDRLEPGWRLLIPDLPAERSSSYRVRSGDTLTGIAERVLHDGDRWLELYEANRFQLDDPDELPVGVRLQLPTAPKAVEKPADDVEQKADTAPPAQAPTPVEASEPEPDALPKPTGRAPDSAPPSAKPQPGHDEAPAQAQVVNPLVAGIAGAGGLLAAAVIAGARSRRRVQLQTRPVGRRIVPPPPAAQLAEAHLGRRQRPMGLRTLDLATRAIAATSHRKHVQPPELALVSVADDRIELQLAVESDTAPDGFDVDGATWRLDALDVDRIRSTPGLSDAVRPYPALVTLGSSADGAQIVADLESLGLTSVDSTDHTLADAALAAIALELSCSPWAEELELILVGTCERLPEALGRHTVVHVDDLDAALDRLAVRAEAQRAEHDGGSVAGRRIDPDRADAWVPTIMIINRALTRPEQRRLQRLVLAEPAVSIAAVGVDLDGAPCRIRLSREGDEPVARIEPYDVVLAPQLLPAPAADAVIDLVEATGETDTAPAPWWFHDESEAEPDPPDNVTYLGRRFGGWARTRPHDHDHDEQEGAAMNRMNGIADAATSAHPVLRLLGPVDLVGAAGPAPTRAAKQCLEYCAWLLEHPGTSPQQMALALAVAEGTRRSNMSRLRSWLGADDLDQPYLPDAYSGRILLHPSVSSDWQRLQILTGRGVNQTGSGGLEAALRLVRGAPLADAAPGQWHWAEGLRTDMISVIRDIGVELADRALAASDIELARWAATRALIIAPGDELLLVARIQTEHRAGNDPEVERLTLQLAAHARALEVDLRPETVDVLQEMMEGRVRARLA